MQRESAIARLAYLTAPGNLPLLGEFVRRSVPHPIPLGSAYEIILQSYLFFGYPQAIEALRVFSQALGDSGLARTAREDGSIPPDEIRRRGQALCRQIYQPNYEQLIQNMKSISVELAEWMVTEGYGRVLSRPGPAKIEREIASIVFLACSYHPVQLFSHVRGARNLGASAEMLMQAVATAGLPQERFELVSATVQRVFDK